MDPGNTFTSSWKVSISFVVFLIFCFTVVNASIEQLMKFYIIVPIFLFVVNVILLLKFGTLRPGYFDAGKVIGSYTNHMVTMSLVSTSIVVYYFMQKKSNIINFFLVFLLCVFNVLISQSRGGVLILFIGIALIILLFRFNIRKKFKYLALTVISLAIVLSILLGVAHTRQLIFSFLERTTSSKIDPSKIFDEPFDQYDKDMSHRIIIFNLGFNTIKQNPVLGIGYGSFKRYMGDYFQRRGILPHNIIISIWTGSGLLGIFLFLGIIYKAFRNVFIRVKHFASVNPEYSGWYIANGIALFLMLISALIRPVLGMPALFLPLAICLMDPPADCCVKDEVGSEQ
jgi:O-antigen ligase